MYVRFSLRLIIRSWRSAGLRAQAPSPGCPIVAPFGRRAPVEPEGRRRVASTGMHACKQCRRTAEATCATYRGMAAFGLLT